jgi:nitronate monooxygenase
MSLPNVLHDRLAIPVIGSPMFILSNPELVIAQCTAGIVGSFPALNARPAEKLEDWLKQIIDALGEWDSRHPDQRSAPYAVNQIVHRTNERLMQDLELCVKYKTPIVISSLAVREDVYEAVHSYGGIVLHDVISNQFAKKAVAKGADGLIAVAAGAGGHAGAISPFALVQEIREWFDGPLALSGAIATGGAVLAAQACGADLAYIGSAFIATEEANAQPAYKQAIVDGAADDIVYSSYFSGVHANYLKAGIVSAGLDPVSLPNGNVANISFGEGAAKMWKDIWASGQGIGAVKSVVPAAEVVARLRREYQDAEARLASRQML